MILDTIQNAYLYKALGERLSIGLEYISNTDFSKLEMGIHKVKEDEVFAILQTYDTKIEEEVRLESHQKYIDIQYLLQGEELVGVEPLTNQEVLLDELEEKDVIFYKGSAPKIKLSKNSFMIFFPTDVHAPGIKIQSSKKVIKVVVKVAV